MFANSEKCPSQFLKVKADFFKCLDFNPRLKAFPLNTTYNSGNRGISIF